MCVCVCESVCESDCLCIISTLVCPSWTPRYKNPPATDLCTCHFETMSTFCKLWPKRWRCVSFMEPVSISIGDVPLGLETAGVFVCTVGTRSFYTTEEKVYSFHLDPRRAREPITYCVVASGPGHVLHLCLVFN